MTMPAYQNCQHQGKGWCLACVGKLANELSETTSELIKANSEIASLRQTWIRKTLPRSEIASLLEYGSCRLDYVEFEHLIGTSDREKLVERMLSAVGFWLRSYDANLDVCSDSALDQIEKCVKENRQ